jgi:hypothetical protein
VHARNNGQLIFFSRHVTWQKENHADIYAEHDIRSEVCLKKSPLTVLDTNEIII